MSKKQRARSSRHAEPAPTSAVGEDIRDVAGGSEGGATHCQDTCPTAEEMQRMISIAAYFRAERRGFVPGYEIDDWFAAKDEIEEQIRA